MRRIARAFIAPTLAMLSLLPLASARADDAIPLERRVDLGRPSRPVEVNLRIEGGEAVLATLSGSRRLRRPLGIATVDEATLEEVQVGVETRAAILRVRSGTTRIGALVVVRRGRPEIPWLERLDARGDPGERIGWAIRTAPAGEHQTILLGRIREGLGLCGAEPALTDARRLDPGSMRLVGTEPDLQPAITDEVATRAGLDSPGPTRPPFVRGLDFDDAFPPGSGGLAALGDRDPSTVWAAPSGGGSAFVRAHWRPAGRPIRALAFFTPSAGASFPAEVWLVGDGGARIRVALPRPDSPRAPVWFVPNVPLDWNCLSIVFEREENSPVGFSEVWAYSDLDFGTGVATLVGELASGGQTARAAARLLGSLGSSATEAIMEAWPDMIGGERRLALGALGAQARRIDGARAALATLARESDPELATSSLEALLSSGEEGERLASELISEPGVGALAARDLSRRAPTVAARALLEAFDATPDDRRPDLRQSLRTSLSRGGVDVLERVRSWAGASQSAEARVQVALAVAGRGPDADAIAASLHALVRSEALGFEERWYLLEIAAALPPSPETASFAAEIARGAEEWMLRAAALEALPRLDSELAAEIAKESLGDPYPRVRAAAIGVLGALGLADESVGALAVDDGWPIVRSAAITALRSNPEARPLLRASVRDPKPRVRVSAIDALAALGDREAWPLIRERLESEVERLVVLESAIAYTRELCLHEALPTLEAVIDRGRRPDAREMRVEAAVAAVVAVAAVGGEGSREILEAAASPGVPTALGSVAHQALDQNPGCDAERP